MLRKNRSNFHKPIVDQTATASGLFASKHSKERVLEQLKRGTLFRWTRQKQPEIIHSQSRTFFQEPKSWIYDIKLGIDNNLQEPQPKPSQVECKKKPVGKLPHISKFKASTVRSHKQQIQRRCDKVTCLTKKLSKVGAWKHQNSKSIDKNISKLERSLNLEEHSLLQDDFGKVQGLNTTQDKSLQSSLVFLDKSTLIESGSAFNPFMKFPNFSQSLGQWQKQRLRDKQNSEGRDKWNSEGRDKWNSEGQRWQQGSFIPTFLMNSILVQSPRANSSK